MRYNIKDNGRLTDIDSARHEFESSRPREKAPSIRIIIGLMFLQQFIASFAYPISKLGLNQIEPFSYAFFRFTIASILFAIILIFKRNGQRILGADRLRMFIIGLILIPGNQLLFLIGQSKTMASHASLLFATTPIFIYVLAIIALGEKFLLRRMIGILIAMAGVYLIISGGKIQFGMQNLVGDLLVLIAAFAWAVGAIMGKPLAQKYGALKVTGLSLTYGSLAYFPFGIYSVINGDYSGVTWSGWFSVFYMAIVISIISYVLWYWILKYMEASRVAVIQNIQPIIATGVAVLILSEPISRNLIIGGMIVIAGVLLTEFK